MTFPHDPIQGFLDPAGIAASTIRRKVFGRQLTAQDSEFQWWSEYVRLMRRTVDRRASQPSAENAS